MCAGVTKIVRQILHFLFPQSSTTVHETLHRRSASEIVSPISMPESNWFQSSILSPAAIQDQHRSPLYYGRVEYSHLFDDPTNWFGQGSN